MAKTFRSWEKFKTVTEMSWSNSRDSQCAEKTQRKKRARFGLRTCKWTVARQPKEHESWRKAQIRACYSHQLCVSSANVHSNPNWEITQLYMIQSLLSWLLNRKSHPKQTPLKGWPVSYQVKYSKSLKDARTKADCTSLISDTYTLARELGSCH